MIWILVTVLVGLVVVLAQLLLTYQKRTARLRIAQNPVRKQIEAYKERLVELGDEVRKMAASNLKQLRGDLTDYQRRSAHAANLTAELDPEAQAWVAARDTEYASQQDDEEKDEETEEDTTNELLGERHEPSYKVETDRTDPVELIRMIRHDLEASYEYIESLRTDAVIVQQTVEHVMPKDKGKDNGAS